jgi:hypothetical protein
VITGEALLVQIFMNILLSQRDPVREELVLSLHVILSLRSLMTYVSHTFPLRSLLSARRSGIGIGGRGIASSIASPEPGVCSLVNLAFLKGIFFLGLFGVCVDPAWVMTSVEWTVPRLVCFFVHATRWNCGELENSRALFLDITENSRQQ